MKTFIITIFLLSTANAETTYRLSMETIKYLVSESCKGGVDFSHIKNRTLADKKCKYYTDLVIKEFKSQAGEK